MMAIMKVQLLLSTLLLFLVTLMGNLLTTTNAQTNNCMKDISGGNPSCTAQDFEFRGVTGFVVYDQLAQPPCNCNCWGGTDCSTVVSPDGPVDCTALTSPSDYQHRIEMLVRACYESTKWSPNQVKDSRSKLSHALSGPISIFYAFKRTFFGAKCSPIICTKSCS
jgi:hypothetical protein